MTEPLLLCSECDRGIALGEAVWYQPFAQATPDADGFYPLKARSAHPTTAAFRFIGNASKAGSTISTIKLDHDGPPIVLLHGAP